jgi:hypothetical protein
VIEFLGSINAGSLDFYPVLMDVPDHVDVDVDDYICTYLISIVSDNVLSALHLQSSMLVYKEVWRLR